jgi:hypothetical protein
MPAVNQSKQPSTGGSAYQETSEQKEAWKKLRAYMRSLNLGVGDTFTVKGTIAKVLLDGSEDNPRYFTKKQVKDDGSEYDWPFVKVMAAITDPAFGRPGVLDFPAKNVGASFFDGVTKKGRSPNRGGMYNLSPVPRLRLRRVLYPLPRQRSSRPTRMPTSPSRPRPSGRCRSSTPSGANWAWAGAR